MVVIGGAELDYGSSPESGPKTSARTRTGIYQLDLTRQNGARSSRSEAGFSLGDPVDDTGVVVQITPDDS